MKKRRSRSNHRRFSRVDVLVHSSISFMRVSKSTSSEEEEVVVLGLEDLEKFLRNRLGQLVEKVFAVNGL